MAYAVLATPAAQRDIRKLPPGVRARFEDVLDSLRGDPRHQAQKLAGEDSWRVRFGDYRVIYRIDDVGRRVLIARVRHRRDVYRQR